VSVDRHLRNALIVYALLGAILGTVSSHWDWSVGAIYAVFAVMAIPGLLYVMRGVPKRPPPR
jgi:hypothetical protein